MTTIVEKTKNAQPVGQYVSTAIDARKAAADVLIRAVEGNGYSVSSKVTLVGRGIKPFGNGYFLVTSAALAAIRTRYAVECDF